MSEQGTSGSYEVTRAMAEIRQRAAETRNRLGIPTTDDKLLLDDFSALTQGQKNFVMGWLSSACPDQLRKAIAGALADAEVGGGA